MRLNFALAKIAQGIFNADDAAVTLDQSGTPITTELYNELRAAERAYISAKFGLLPGDTVLVSGLTQPDFTANFRGRSGDFAVVVLQSGMQVSVPYYSCSKISANQEKFNSIQKEIAELTAERPYTFGPAHGDLLRAIKELEIKLAEVAAELTAERHATQY